MGIGTQPWMPPESRTSHKVLVLIIRCFFIIVCSHVLIHGICSILLPSVATVSVANPSFDWLLISHLILKHYVMDFDYHLYKKKVFHHIIATLLQGPSYLQRNLSKPCKEWAIYRAGIARNVPDENEGQNLWTKKVEKGVKAWRCNERIMSFVELWVTDWSQSNQVRLIKSQ